MESVWLVSKPRSTRDHERWDCKISKPFAITKVGKSFPGKAGERGGVSLPCGFGSELDAAGLNELPVRGGATALNANRAETPATGKSIRKVLPRAGVHACAPVGMPLLSAADSNERLRISFG